LGHHDFAEDEMTRFNFRAPAELFTGRSARGSRPMRYHRFDTGAEAVRFAIETLTPDQLLACVIKIDENRYRHGEIRAFYESADYPLPLKMSDKQHAGAPAAAKTPTARKAPPPNPPPTPNTPARKTAVKSRSAA
jgi:hypothetical protein